MFMISTAVSGRARSRVQSKQETRERLLAAAAELAAEKGFANVALMDVAVRAGLTTGAVYSNFRSREELLMEVAFSRLQSLQGDLPRSESRDLVEIARASAHFANGPKTRQLVALQVELYLLALRDAKFKQELRTRNQGQLAALTGILAELADVPAPGPRPPLEQVAEAFIAMLQGLQQHRLLYPDQVPDELFGWCAAALLRAAIKPEER